MGKEDDGRKCDVCGSSNVVLTTNSRVYKRNYGDDPRIYYCEDCGAWVRACHPKNSPRARMVSRYTHRLRKLCHNRFDYIWNTGLISRGQLYKRLSAKLGVPAGKAHFGVMSDELLEKCVLMLYPDDGDEVIQASREFFGRNF